MAAAWREIEAGQVLSQTEKSRARNYSRIVFRASWISVSFMELLRGTRFDLITHSWMLYTTLVTLAIVALYQITAENDENSDD